MSPAGTTAESLVVEAEGLCKSYGRGATMTPVLSGVDLMVRRGECVFLAGPSGSGKTTLLSILGCILSPDGGTIRVLGEDLRSLDAKGHIAMRRDRIGFVFQRFHLIRGLSASHNVCVPLTLRRVAQRAARSRASDLLEAVGLADKAHLHLRNLSAGQCQRVALARALVGDPQLVLADEPTASLDAANGQEVMALMRRLTTEKGRTAIVVTHDQRIFHFADRICWLENGRVADTRVGSGGRISPSVSEKPPDDQVRPENHQDH